MDISYTLQVTVLPIWLSKIILFKIWVQNLQVNWIRVNFSQGFKKLTQILTKFYSNLMIRNWFLLVNLSHFIKNEYTSQSCFIWIYRDFPMLQLCCVFLCNTCNIYFIMCSGLTLRKPFQKRLFKYYQQKWIVELRFGPCLECKLILWHCDSWFEGVRFSFALPHFSKVKRKSQQLQIESTSSYTLLLIFLALFTFFIVLCYFCKSQFVFVPKNVLFSERILYNARYNTFKLGHDFNMGWEHPVNKDLF